MTHDEMVNLIRAGIPILPSGERVGGIWADYGAGWGNFTRALRALVGPAAVIYAVDRDESAFRHLRERHGDGGPLHTVVADFTEPLDLPLLDGAIVANALHFVRQQRRALSLLAQTLKPGGRLIVVEYDVVRPRPWIPYPMPAHRTRELLVEVGLHNVRVIGQRTSPSTGLTMVATAADKPPPEPS